MRSNSGFTLLEILVIVAIIGILGAIAIPNLIGQAPKLRLQNAANDLRGELQITRMKAIKDRKEKAVIFNQGTNNYQIVDSGPDRLFGTGDDIILKTVNLGPYNSGVGYGHGDAAGNYTDDDPNRTTPIGSVNYNSNVVVFQPTGLIRSEAAVYGGGFVYLTNQRGDAFAVGTPTLTGIVTMRIWNGGSWTL